MYGRRFQSRFAIVVVSGLLLARGVSAGEAAGRKEAAGDGPVEIRKLYFLFHPVCWSMGMRGDQPPPKVNAQEYLTCYRWEKKNVEKQKQVISNMRPDEALVLFPIGRSPAMQDIENHAVKTLGRRCIIMKWEVVGTLAAWAKIPNFYERFISDEPLEGREKFLKTIPPEIQRELRDEIRTALRTRKGDWNVNMLKVIYTSRMYAWELKKALRERQLKYDPATVESEAFGEGFEQCAMTWKTMLVPYLGLAKPAENNFELSVSGAPYLAGAKFKERIPLAHDTRLFLWEAADGRCVGMYAHPWFRVGDPLRHARMPVQGRSLEVWELMQKRWPADDSSAKASQVTAVDGHLKVPVFNAIRRDHVDAFYILARGMSYDDFRRMLVEAAIVE